MSIMLIQEAKRLQQLAGITTEAEAEAAQADPAAEKDEIGRAHV